jgi:hypothetical protein
VSQISRACPSGSHNDILLDCHIVCVFFWMLGGAGLALPEAPEEDKPRLGDEWGHLIHQTIRAMRIN